MAVSWRGRLRRAQTRRVARASDDIGIRASPPLVDPPHPHLASRKIGSRLPIPITNSRLHRDVMTSSLAPISRLFSSRIPSQNFSLTQNCPLPPAPAPKRAVVRLRRRARARVRVLTGPLEDERGRPISVPPMGYGRLRMGPCGLSATLGSPPWLKLRRLG